MTKEMGTQSLVVKSDPQLVTGKVTGEYHAKDPQMAAYLKYVQVLKGALVAFGWCMSQENRMPELTC